MKKRVIDGKKIKRGVQIFDLLLFALFIVIFVISITNRAALEEFASIKILQFGLVGLFIVNFFLEFVPQFITPVFTLLLSLITVLNVHLVMLSVVLGSFFGSLSGYFVGVKYGFGLVEDLIGDKKCKIVVKFMGGYGGLAVLLAALSPLPYIPMIIGSLNMKFKHFIFYGLIPRAVGLITMGYLFYFGVL